MVYLHCNLPDTDYGVFRSAKITAIVIGEGVTSIGRNAFNDCTQLTSLTLPEGITSVGRYAFNDCRGMTSLTLPSTLRAISDHAFKGCSALTEVVVPEGVEAIEEYAFEGLTSLRSFTLPATIQTLGKAILSGTPCTLYLNCDIPSVSFYGDAPFYSSKLTGVVIGEGVTAIGDYAFRYSTSLEAVTFPSSLRTIGKEAFIDCTGLTELTLPAGIEALGERAFNNCRGLVAITILIENPIEIKDNVFANIDMSQVTLIVPEWLMAAYGDTEPWKSAGTVEVIESPKALEGDCGPNLHYLLADGTLTITGTGVMYAYSFEEIPWYDKRSAIRHINIAEGATSLCERAFYGCTEVQTIQLPSTLDAVGADAFTGCHLRTIVAQSASPQDYSTAFSAQTYIHAPLFVPQRTKNAYTVGSGWSDFRHIWEYASTDVNVQKAYLLADADGMNYVVMNPDNGELETRAYLHELDTEEEGIWWMAEAVAGGFALRNVLLDKYLDVDAEGHFSLYDQVRPLTVSFIDDMIEVNGHRMMWLLRDGDIATEIAPLPAALPNSTAPIYDLSGRQLPRKPVHGYYIQQGKTILNLK